MSELKHYGVKGMKWGVRKDRDKPSYGERRQVRKLKGAYKSAVKGVQRRTEMADDDRTALARSEKAYETIQKKGRGFTKATREQRDRDVQNAELDVNRRNEALKKAEINQRRAQMIMNDRTKELADYVNSLNEKYGKEKVKQLELRSKPLKAGSQYVLENVYKTGIRVQDFPVIGRQIVGKQLAQWEEEYRYKERVANEDETLTKYRR